MVNIARPLLIYTTMTRKYVLIGDCYKLVTTFKVNDVQVPVSFEDGNRMKNRHGYFVTDNEDLQDAIEESDSYDCLFTREISNDYPEEVTVEPENTIVEPVTPPVVEPVNAEETVVNPEPENGPVLEEVVEPVAESTEVTAEEVTAEPIADTPAVDEKLLEVNNYTLAKNYIKELFPEVTRAEILSEEKLREYAKEKGITFPNW